MRPEPTAPSATQLTAFAALSVEARYAWYCQMLELCFALSTPGTRARWRELKQRPPRRSAAGEE